MRPTVSAVSRSRTRSRDGAVTAATAVLAALLSGCVGSGYGASFDYPSPPPVPTGTSVVVEDTGADDDDPIRSRVLVLDTQTIADGELKDSYRDAYPRSDGWAPAQRPHGADLCLVNRTDDEFTQVLEVYPYAGSQVAGKPERRLVVLSRTEQAYPGTRADTRWRGWTPPCSTDWPGSCETRCTA